MWERQHVKQVTWGLVFLMTILFAKFGLGQPTVQLVADPPVERLLIGAEPQQIWIVARTVERGVQFKWEVSGPGEFNIEPDESFTSTLQFGTPSVFEPTPFGTAGQND